MKKFSILIICIVLGTLFSSINAAQDGQGFDNIISSPDCSNLCFMGIEPSITTPGMLEDLLTQAGIRYSIVNRSRYRWEIPNASAPINNKQAFIARFENGVVSYIEIPLVPQDEATVLDFYGPPSMTTMTDTQAYYLSYPASGLGFLQNWDNKKIAKIVLVPPQTDFVENGVDSVLAVAGDDIATDDSDGYPALVLLDATSSVANNGTISSVSWLLNNEVVSEIPQVYVPVEYGRHLFILSVENNEGVTDFDSIVVNVSPIEREDSSGLLGEYYFDLNQQDLRFERVDSVVDFDWGLDSPRPDIGNFNFSVVWRGQLEVPVTGTYTFYSNSDDGISMWIDGDKVFKQLIYEDSQPAEVELKGGEAYDIRLEYYEAGGNANVDLLWTIPQGSAEPEVIPSEYFSYATLPEDIPPLANAGSDQIIPIEDETSTKVSLDSSASIGRGAPIVSYQWNLKGETLSEEATTTVDLKPGIHNIELVVIDENGLTDRDQVIVEVNNFSRLSGLRAEYFSDTNLNTFVTERIDRIIDFQWGYIAPDPSMDVINYSARWSGFIEASETGIHHIYTLSDDGVRMQIQGKQLINDWNSHAPQYNSFSFYMKQGHTYPIEIEYFQAEGNAVIHLLWSTPSNPELEVISQGYLLQPEFDANTDEDN